MDQEGSSWVYLIAAASGWLIAQLLKYIFYAYKSRNWGNISWFYQSGGMPSSHSAITVALATIIGLKDGFDSGIFAIAAVLAAIVMYDAMQVRRSSGEQGFALRKLLKKAKISHNPYHALGHTPREVLAGAATGVLVSVAVAFFITYIS